MTIIGFILVTILAIIIANVRIVPQEYVMIIERLGVYHTTWKAGLHVKMPLIDSIRKKITLKEQVFDFPPQPVITKDNVTMMIDSVVFIKIFDPKAYVYGIEKAIDGLANLSATNLRSIVGEMQLDDTLASRDKINDRMRIALDEATDPWGIKVIRVEVKNIQPPSEIEEVMTKQMRAERERRETVLQAEAHQQSIVMRAEGDKKAKVLSAEAERDAQIAIAEGKAKSVKLVYEAEAEGIKKLREAGINENILKLRSIEALKNIADGRATKIFIPNDLSNVLATVGSLTEAAGIGDCTPIDKSEKPKNNKKIDPCIDDDSNKITKADSEQGKSVTDALEDMSKDISIDI